MKTEMTPVEERAPLWLDLPEIERDAAGIPTFIFKQELSEGDRPGPERKTLEVVLYWREAVMNIGHYENAREITIGDALDNDFRISSDDIPSERFSLVAEHDGEFILNWSGDMTLEVKTRDGEICGRNELERADKVTHGSHYTYAVSHYALGLHERAAIQVGEVTFVLQFVSPARVLRGSFLGSIDYYYSKVLSLSFSGHLFFVLALLFTPLAPDGLTDALFKTPNRFAQVEYHTPPKPPPPPTSPFQIPSSNTAHRGNERKLGSPEDNPPDAQPSSPGAPTVNPEETERRRQIAMKSGIFIALQGGPESNASNLFGPGGIGSGINKAIGGFKGTALGDPRGVTGLGTRGTGPGGHGPSLGIGGFGPSARPGPGNVDLGHRPKRSYQVTPGRTVAKGCLKASVVRRVLSRTRNMAKHCYEKELPRNPNLSGKVTTGFVIGPTGNVLRSSIIESTLGSANVEKCLLKVIERLKFPPCAGGGRVDVTYPWIFMQGG